MGSAGSASCVCARWRALRRAWVCYCVPGQPSFTLPGEAVRIDSSSWPSADETPAKAKTVGEDFHQAIALVVTFD